MKIRSGFVSNSSSSSFVMLGFGTNESFDENDKDLKGFDELYIEGEYEYLVGRVIADGDDYLEYSEISNINEKINEIAIAFDKDPADIKLFCGTRPC